MSRDDSIERFVAHMVAFGGDTFGDGSSVEDYARERALSYWEDEDQREDGPEECAEVDIEYRDVSLVIDAAEGPQP